MHEYIVRLELLSIFLKKNYSKKINYPYIKDVEDNLINHHLKIFEDA